MIHPDNFANKKNLRKARKLKQFAKDVTRMNWKWSCRLFTWIATPSRQFRRMRSRFFILNWQALSMIYMMSTPKLTSRVMIYMMYIAKLILSWKWNKNSFQNLLSGLWRTHKESLASKQPVSSTEYQWMNFEKFFEEKNNQWGLMNEFWKVFEEKQT